MSTVSPALDVLRADSVRVAEPHRVVVGEPIFRLEDRTGAHDLGVVIIVRVHGSVEHLLQVGYRTAVRVAGVGEEPRSDVDRERALAQPFATRVTPVGNSCPLS